MSSSGSSGSGRWGNHLTFDSDSQFSGNKHTIPYYSLKSKLSQLVNAKEQIKQVVVYKTPLSESQWTMALFHHKYVCFQTSGGWWWSIQKNNQQILIQRSRILKHVKDYRQQSLRCKTSYWNPKQVSRDTGRFTIEDLISWIDRNNVLTDTYNWLLSNCQHFASQVFNYLAKTKTITHTA